MKAFETGKTYSTRSICDTNCIITMKVLSRTAKTITALVDDEVKKLRISSKLSSYRNAETVLPWGSYSMAPMISAD